MMEVIDLKTSDHSVEAAIPSSVTEPWWAVLLGASLVALTALVVYANSFSVPFVFDDLQSIPNNSSIRRLGSLGKILSPPTAGETVTGRPVLNLSLAVNYAICGRDTWGYHAANLGIHVLSAWLLLGIVRRMLRTGELRSRFGPAATWLATAIALLWTVHPLQTESVTYIVQRAESQAGLFYLLTLYSAIRGAESKRGRLWSAVAVVACFLGAGTKETVVTAPLMVLLYDRMFLAGTFREALRRRWGLYLGLAASWALLIGLAASTRMLLRRDEMKVPDLWSYARSQPGVILGYLRLSFWPDPLCLDREWPVASTLAAIVPGMLVGSLLAATVWRLVGRKAAGFVGAWFFLILAPSSSVVPLGQLAFEHRMYLSLAAVIALVVAIVYAGIQRLVRRGWLTARAGVLGGLCLLVAATEGLGYLTYQRNKAYRTMRSIWEDTVAKAPHNSRAHHNLGSALLEEGRWSEAIARFQEAVRLKPDFAEVHTSLGCVMVRMGRAREAVEHFKLALRYQPDLPDAYYNWGNAMTEAGNLVEAIELYRHAVDLRPDYAEAHNNLANALSRLGRLDEAFPHYRQAIDARPDYAEAHYNWANSLASRDRPDEAIDHYRRALQLNPNYAAAQNNWGETLARLGRFNEAIDHYQEAVRLQPGMASAHYNLAIALGRSGRLAEAIAHARQLVSLMPREPEGNRLLAWLMATHEAAGKNAPEQAVALAERACDLTHRRDIASLDTLAAALAAAGRFDEAVTTANEALQAARSAGRKALADEIEPRLRLYKDRKPYRE